MYVVNTPGFTVIAHTAREALKFRDQFSKEGVRQVTFTDMNENAVQQNELIKRAEGGEDV